MHRFHLPPRACSSPDLELTGNEAHHARQVLRLQRGERLVILDGAGQELLCDVRDADRDHVGLHVLQRNAIPPLPYQITLIQAVPKGKTMDIIVEKATELGAHRIIPVLSQRAIPQLDPAAVEAKIARWQQTAIEAIKQCGSAWLPLIEPPVSPQAFLGRGERFDLQLIASLQPGSLHPREYFRRFATEQNRPPRSLAVWVGPEGDFTPAEVNAIRGAGALPITLGQLVLRSETAAIYCLSVFHYELQS